MDHAISKLKRATKHIDELNKLLCEKRPFKYIVETDTRTGQRSIRSKKDETVIAEATEIASDAIQNMRAALDYAYWEIVSPRATTPRETKAIQFPFSESAARLEEAIKNRLAHKVSDRFFKVILALKPHGEDGGNELLYAIHDLAAPDRHRMPVPSGNYTEVTGSLIKAHAPDFPMASSIGNIAFGNSTGGDIRWRTPKNVLASIKLGTPVIPTTHKFEKELPVPVYITLQIGPHGLSQPMIPTLHKMVSISEKVIKIIRAAAI